MAKFMSWGRSVGSYRNIFTTELIKKKYRLGAVLLLKACARCDLGGSQLQPAGCFEFFDSIGYLPGEVGVFSAEVTVGCCFLVDGATQV